MPFVPLNVVLENRLTPGSTLSLPYPEGKDEGFFFSAINHTMSFNGTFYRCPRDFLISLKPDRILLTWHGKNSLPQGALLNLQLEAPGGDFYHDSISGVTVRNMVASPLFMVNLGSPRAPRDDYFFSGNEIKAGVSLSLRNNKVHHARTITIKTSGGDGNNDDITFSVYGEDMYGRDMAEHIKVAATGGIAYGRKAFQSVIRITADRDYSGKILVGTHREFGLPVYIAGSGFLIREILNGQPIRGGMIVPGETASPTATSGDRRGLYIPPPDVDLNGASTIYLLFSLPNPGNIGTPDYAG